MPLTHLASKVVVRTQENLMKARDKRTGLMNEILQGIRMLKYAYFYGPFWIMFRGTDDTGSWHGNDLSRSE